MYAAYYNIPPIIYVNTTPFIESFSIKTFGVNIQVSGIVLCCSQLQWMTKCPNEELFFQQFKKYSGYSCYYFLV